MEQKEMEEYTAILRKELIPAMGCTEPISIAYAAAVARRLMGRMPDRVEGHLSGNIVKNVKCVIVPNSGGQKGINVAIALGLAAGDPDKKLEVISDVDDSGRERMQALLRRGIITSDLSESDIPLDIELKLTAGEDTVVIRIAETHLNIVHLEKNGHILTDKPVSRAPSAHCDLTAEKILDYARDCPLEEVEDLLDRQIRYNEAISREGLSSPWGSCIGQTILEGSGDVRARAAAWAAAGSDARMNGCELPVVINSGSGNQGITVCLPVLAYARELHSPREKMLRALLVSNLLAIYQKKEIGSLSAYCGAVSAACGSAAGIAYLRGFPRKVILDTFSNGLAIASGVVCDGASASCAGKIAVGVFSGLLGMDLACRECSLLPGDGIVGSDIDNTVSHVAAIARDGMQETDRKILQIMMNE